MKTLGSIGDLERVVVTVPESILFQELEEEFVLLNLETGEYYGLNEVGSRTWALLQEHQRLDQVLLALLEAYDVAEERLKADLRALLADLEVHGLVRVHDDAP